ncbi:hybrid sensor histidine kinase/response regulator [Granulosicoccus antarcticus]|uniref:histidine kinase n=1 Tax=Granulosicoccus antarcticus IMCC3135 TaxID=1192854 RepID=A0A2Z2NSH5_9GAMM|nr:PAS domain-containing sensor histidine kinase [Granulosicoccus antarcticus]ASJ72698.1 Blue-light-activated protein [Granulosicoccus antarcticus IMCC3135]
MDFEQLQLHNERLQRELVELRKSNEELQVCKQQLDALMDNSPVEVYFKDRQGRYLKVNKKFERIFGIKEEKTSGLLPEDICAPNLADSSRDHDLSVLSSGITERREVAAKIACDDQLHTLLTIKFPVFNQDGEIDGLGAIITDISERKQIAEALRRAQRMDAIGQLSGGIAHDFNNILGIVMGNLELLEPHLENNKNATFYLESALKGAERGAELTRKILSFSRPPGGLVKCICLNDFILGMEAITAKSLPVSTDMETQLNDDLWSVCIDPGELEDAILNLTLNARDALSNGGKVIIRTSNEVIDEIYVRFNPQATEGDFVMLSVSDNGHGMTPDIIKRATEPFFTMKEASNGTGLGLSMVYGFVKRSGGHMKILSKPNAGTEVRLYLPRSDELIECDKTISKNTTIQGGSETILIVDDETGLVEIAVTHLQKLGYTTYTANNSQQAMELLDAHEQIDMLFLDVIMPGDMDGLELATAVRHRRPNLKVLLTSGFTRQVHEAAEWDLDADADFKSKLLGGVLKKPYDKQSLSAAVRRVLDTNPPS